jgi:hypothetical protein
MAQGELIPGKSAVLRCVMLLRSTGFRLRARSEHFSNGNHADAGAELDSISGLDTRATEHTPRHDKIKVLGYGQDHRMSLRRLRSSSVQRASFSIMLFKVLRLKVLLPP